MVAIAFDLPVAATAASHPKEVSQACADSGSTLAGSGFDRVQRSLSLAELASRAFEVEHWSDFTRRVKA